MIDFSHDIMNFIHANMDKNKKKLEDYSILNTIRKKEHRVLKPYSIPMEVMPTYKTIELKYIKDKKYFIPISYAKGGTTSYIFIFKSENFDQSEYI